MVLRYVGQRQVTCLENVPAVPLCFCNQPRRLLEQGLYIRIAVPAASYTDKCGYWLHFYILWSLVTAFISFIYRFSLQFSLMHIMAVGTGSSSACDFRVCVFILCVNEMSVIICSQNGVRLSYCYLKRMCFGQLRNSYTRYAEMLMYLSNMFIHEN